MKLRKVHVAVATVTVAALSTGCGASPPTYDNNLFASTICVDNAWMRVPDNYCPIGDQVFPDHPYHWVYDEYTANEADLDIVYVGYPVERTRYITTRPSRVPTLNIDRGRFPERPQSGVNASTVRIPTIAVERKQGSSSVQRGGLGVPNARATAAPTPVRRPDSPAPGRATQAAAPSRAAAAPPRAATPPRPAARPVSPPRVSTGKR